MRDPRIERLRHQDLDDDVDRVEELVPEGTPALLLTTTQVGMTYPGNAGAFYACNPTQVAGVETEGGNATYIADQTQILFAWNAGSKSPPKETRVIASAVGGRWVFRYDGAPSN
jgi:hypothetical protein